MNFAKMIFAMLLFIIGFLVGITEVFVLINPTETLTLGNSNFHSPLLGHATYLLYTISSLGMSFLLLKSFNKTELILK